MTDQTCKQCGCLLAEDCGDCPVCSALGPPPKPGIVIKLNVSSPYGKLGQKGLKKIEDILMKTYRCGVCSKPEEYRSRFDGSRHVHLCLVHYVELTAEDASYYEKVKNMQLNTIDEKPIALWIPTSDDDEITGSVLLRDERVGHVHRYVLAIDNDKPITDLIAIETSKVNLDKYWGLEVTVTGTYTVKTSSEVELLANKS